MDKKYFEGLDVLRAIAAILVIIHHFELTINREFGAAIDTGIVQNAAIYIIGKRGVHVFFMLSGFLITLLLIKEKSKLGKVALGKFYMRRIFRIWPLYFMTVGIGFFLLPLLLRSFDFLSSLQYYPSLIHQLDNGSESPILYFLFFIPNLALEFYPAVPGASHLWSIGVEEQFYLFWPLIFFIPKPRIQLLAITSVALMPFLPYLLVRIPGATPLASWVGHFPFYWMAFGGLGAFFYHKYLSTLERIFSKYDVLSWLVILSFFTIGLSVKIGDFLFGAVGLLMILRFSIGKQWGVNRFQKMIFLGKISFGLYVYHPLVMFIVLSGFQFYFPDWHESIVMKIEAYGAVFALTIVTAWLSFHYFEKPFIQLKDQRFKSY